MKNTFILKGRIRLLLDGVEVVKKDNLIVNSGLSLVANFLTGLITAPIAINEIGVGDGILEPNPTDTALENELIRSILAASNPTIYTAEFTKIWTPGEVPGTYTEAGLFETSITPSPGNMFSRIVFPPVEVTAAHQLTAIWTITVISGV